MKKDFSFSCEFFPPKTEDMMDKLWDSIAIIANLSPKFISVTYGAGGSTRENTHRIAKTIAANTGIPVAAHLTCVGLPIEQVNVIAKEHLDAGIQHIVALRGDPPKGSSRYVPFAGGYAHTTDLMQGLKTVGDFEISVAAFPEKHLESKSFEEDIEVLKRKEDLGAKRAITQYFFDNRYYLELRERAAKAGITMPIVAGMIPINHYANIKRFSDMCGTSMSAAIMKKFAPLDEYPALRDEAAIAFASQQCNDLLKEGVNDFHFYTMNRGDLISAIYHRICA